MPITYTNRKGLTYFLCKSITKTGKLRYYFAREQKGEPVGEIPQGYIVKENVNGIVSLAKERPQLISRDESAAIEAALERHPQGNNYRTAVKDKQIIVYEGISGGMDSVIEILKHMGLKTAGTEDRLQVELDRYTQFTPVMRFTLDDKETRQYHVERWCYRGRIDDWIYTGHSGEINELAKRLIPTLGTDDFYELY